MAGYESFYREDPLEIRPAQLPAEVYNLAHRLLVRSGGSCLFVPVRGIQFLAVIDAEEIIFVDREAKHLVELAWRHFRPQARAGLGEPVPYEIHLYLAKARLTLPRLQGEFFKALALIEQRLEDGRGDGSRILPFPERNK
ncbi:MAG: hypothetical protein HZB57_06425 [Gammaproteobacteria bacterium]|nr:hypothetical protein [Gammaproteobacteria bacterium]